MRRRTTRILRILAITVALFGLGEYLARRSVPQSGLTPFREPTLNEVSLELARDFETTYQGQPLSTNSSGFRGPEFPEPDPDKLRIALVGDSFTFGNGIPWEDTLGVCLEHALLERGVESQVLNFGVPGYNAEESAATLAARVVPQDPEQVIYVAFPNDHQAQVDFPPPDPNSKIDSYHGFRARSALAEWGISHAKDVARKFGRSLERRTKEFSEAEYEQGGRELMRRSLERMRAVCDQHDMQLLVAIYPFMIARENNLFLPIEEGIYADCKELGIEVIELEAAFEGCDKRAMWAHPVFDSHPNGDANRLVAELLAARLVVQ